MSATKMKLKGTTFLVVGGVMYYFLIAPPGDAGFFVGLLTGLVLGAGVVEFIKLYESRSN